MITQNYLSGWWNTKAPLMIYCEMPPRSSSFLPDDFIFCGCAITYATLLIIDIKGTDNSGLNEGDRRSWPHHSHSLCIGFYYDICISLPAHIALEFHFDMHIGVSPYSTVFLLRAVWVIDDARPPYSLNERCMFPYRTQMNIVFISYRYLTLWRYRCYC